jgi:hypothetical protein
MLEIAMPTAAHGTVAPATHPGLTAPIVDYEPEPAEITAARPRPCPMPTPTALHRTGPRPLVPAGRPAREPPLPRAAAVFADTAVRRVLEVVDRRRPAGQLRNMVRPSLIDAISVLARNPSAEGAARLQRLRLRAYDATGAEPSAAELFATYTRGTRVRAIAGRIEVVAGRWQLVALHVG